MDFGQWYLRRGRTTRRTWWLHYTLPLFGLSILAGIADGTFGYPGLAVSQPASGVVDWFGGPLSTAVALFSVVPSLSSSVTRMHDRGHSAWWLLWGFVPFAGPVVLLVQTGCLRGDGGPNRYGPAPVAVQLPSPA